MYSFFIGKYQFQDIIKDNDYLSKTDLAILNYIISIMFFSTSSFLIFSVVIFAYLITSVEHEFAGVYNIGSFVFALYTLCTYLEDISEIFHICFATG